MIAVVCNELVASVRRPADCRQQQKVNVMTEAVAMEIEDASYSSVRTVVSCAADESDKALSGCDWLLVIVDDQLPASSVPVYTMKQT